MRPHAERGNEAFARFNPQSAIRNPQSRSALTLIELLVVIIILTTVVAAAIPILAPADSDRRLREATRGLNTFITSAQTRAIALKRPFGIALKRLSADTGNNSPGDLDNDNGVCLEVFFVEQQPPYAGFEANSRACVALPPGNSNLRQLGLVLIRFVTRGATPIPDGLPPGWDADLFPGGTIRPGDVLEMGDTRYELSILPYLQTGPLVNGYYPPNWGGSPNEGRPVTIAARPINDTGQQFIPKYDGRGDELGANVDRKPIQPFWTAPAPYRILRQPTRTSDAPHQLPEGTAIDLRASGFGDGYFYRPGEFDNAEDVLIMFAPEGRISRLYFNPNVGTQTTNALFRGPIVDNLFLLVGKRENSPPPPVDDDPTLDSAKWNLATTDEARQELKEPINWLNGDSRWLVMGPQSGRIVTVENAFVDPGLAIDGPPAIAQSTELLRNEQIRRAREFTRDMANVGGR